MADNGSWSREQGWGAGGTRVDHNWKWHVALTLKPGPNNILCPARPVLLNPLKHFYHLTTHSDICVHFASNVQHKIQSISTKLSRPSFLTLFCLLSTASGCDHQLHFIKMIISGVTIFMGATRHLTRAAGRGEGSQLRLQCIGTGGPRTGCPLSLQSGSRDGLLLSAPCPSLGDSAAHPHSVLPPQGTSAGPL